MQLGKFVASNDNTLIRDGIIDEGKIKQEISDRLQNIERGELVIELECIPCDYPKGKNVSELKKNVGGKNFLQWMFTPTSDCYHMNPQREL